MKRFAASAAPLLLSACAVPNTSLPSTAAVAVPAAWRTPAGPATPIAADWWTRFGDPALDRLVERALAANPDVAIAAARVREARAQERLARAQLVPSLDLGVGVERARSLDPFGRPSTATNVQPTFQAAYELDLFGRIADDVAAARAGTASAAAARDALRLSVAAATASSYVTLRGLDARLAIVRETVASRAQALRIARDRVAAGYSSQLELSQAEAEYRSASQLVAQSELAIARQENALSQLLGDPPHAVARGPALDRIGRPPVPAGLPSDLLRRRPDIAEAEWTLAASDSTLAAARAQYLPQVQLAAATGAIVSSALGDPVAVWSLGGSVLAPLFAGGRLRAGEERAAARRDQAALNYRRTVLTAFREVEDNLAAVARLGEQRTEQEGQRAALVEALRHATNRFQAGYSSYLDQLDAQRNLLTTELTLVQSDVDQLEALIALHQAMGGGWTGERSTSAVSPK